MSTETKIIYQNEVFEKVKSATNKMCDLIRPTLGPSSNKIIIDKLPYRMVCDDGVQAARDFELNDPVENAIVKLVREVLVRTNDRAGDGTTGAAIILQAIINEVARKTKFDGRKIELELKKGLEEARAQLLKMAKPIKTKADLKKVALISFDNEAIAEMVADLYFKLGKEALVTIDTSTTMETYVEMTEGVSIARGYISPYMVSDPDRMECVIEKPYILLTDFRLTEQADLYPLMNSMSEAGKRGLVVIAENVEQGALSYMVLNLPTVARIDPQTGRQVRGNFPSVALNLPKVDDRKTLLEDLAILTGAKVFTAEKGDKLETATVADLGRADKFIARRDDSVIIGPKGKKTAINIATAALRSAIRNETLDSKRKNLEYRLGMFTNALAVIKVGAATDNERKTLRYKVEDAVNSVKSAFKNGVVCGSGLAFARIKTSSAILNEALKYPYRQICENTGLEEELSMPADWAKNAVTGKSGNFLEVGVMDPIDALLAGIESAVSIASILLTSTGIIVESTKETK